MEVKAKSEIGEEFPKKVTFHYYETFDRGRKQCWNGDIHDERGESQKDSVSSFGWDRLRWVGAGALWRIGAGETSPPQLWHLSPCPG